MPLLIPHSHCTLTCPLLSYRVQTKEWPEAKENLLVGNHRSEVQHHSWESLFCEAIPQREKLYCHLRNDIKMELILLLWNLARGFCSLVWSCVGEQVMMKEGYSLINLSDLFQYIYTYRILTGLLGAVKWLMGHSLINVSPRLLWSFASCS